MSVNNIIDGRERAIEILNILSPKEAEILYGPQYGGMNYCSFKYKKDNEWIGVTVRTTSLQSYIKFSKKLLDYNIAACHESYCNHELILGFNWDKVKRIYILSINNLSSLLEYVSKVLKRDYIVVKEEMLVGGVGNGICKLV